MDSQMLLERRAVPGAQLRRHRRGLRWVVNSAEQLRSFFFALSR
jgi:hypothetical protein